MTNSTAKVSVSETIEAQANEISYLREQLLQVQAMFAAEDHGWQRLFGDAASEGMTLQQLRNISQKLREALVGNVWLGRAFRLRNGFIQSGGIQYAGQIPSGGRGRAVNVQARINDAQNQAAYFGAEAREEREKALLTDGGVFLVGHEATKTLRAISVAQITNYITNPDFPSEVWAYERTWLRKTASEPAGVTVKRWYFTDRYVALRGQFAFPDGQEVDTEHVIFDAWVNGQVDWALGIPDSIAAYSWSQQYRDFLLNGKVMSDALAQFAFQAKTSKKISDNVALKPASKGATVNTGLADQLLPMQTAGKGYDFDSGRALAAPIAAALDVTTIALLSDPAAGGGSYSAASSLDLPGKLIIEARRKWHVELETRVLKWLGAEDVQPYFYTLDDGAEQYRKSQGVILGWNAGLYSAEETKASLELLKGNPSATAVPDGVMLPNNENFAGTATATASAATVASPNQGQSNGTGGDPNASNQIRTDSVNP